MAKAQDKPRALVGAATRIRLNDKQMVKNSVSRREEWQSDGWDFFDLVPEVKQLTWQLGNMISKLRLFVAVDNPKDPDGDPIPVSDPNSGIEKWIADRANAELARLGNGAGGHSELLRCVNMNLEVAAEGYLIGQSARAEVVDERTGKVKEAAKPERWRVKSIREVEVKDKRLPNGETSRLTVKDDPDDKKGEPLDPTLDVAIRFWQQHPAFERRADCAMRACLDDCETLLVLKQQLRAEARSHIPAGFLFAASDLTWAHLNPLEDDEEGDETEPKQHPLMKQMADVMNEVMEDPSHVGSLAPMLGLIPLGEGDDIRQKVMHLSLARSTKDSLDARIKARVETLARGLNAPPEKIMGHQETTYANAKQVDSDIYKDHLDPRALLIVDILTVGFLRPQLLEPEEPDDDDDAAEVEPGTPEAPAQTIPEEIVDRLFVWYDPSSLVHQPDRESNADAAHEKGEISGASYRAAKGFGENDKPSPEEMLIRTALRRGGMTGAVTLAILELLGVPLDVQPLPGAEEPEAAAMAALLEQLGQDKALRARARQMLLRTDAIEAAARPRPVSTRQLVDIDRDLRARLLVLADRTMARALDRVGASLRGRATASVQAQLKGIPNADVAAQMGMALTAATADVDAILDEVFAGMESSFMSWGATAQRQALDVASRLASGFSVAQRDALGLRQAQDLGEAWAWLRETLTSLAHAKLYDPSTPLAAVGEFDANLSVQAGVVRQSITRAGGLAGVQTGDGVEAWLSFTDGGTRPAGGIGTGELIMGALAEQGASIETYVWDYGPGARTRPFEPHVFLDGVEFENFDDDILRNADSFPLTASYMPGDHDGCLCDFIPLVSAPSGNGDSEPLEPEGGE